MSKKLFLLFSISLVIFYGRPVFAANTVDIYFFRGQGCPHCAKEEAFLNKAEQNDKNIRVRSYEVWYNQENQKFLLDLSKALNIRVEGVPLTIVGGKEITGYLNDETTGKEIADAIKTCEQTECQDPVENYLLHKNAGTSASAKIENINLPLFGDLDIKKISLPILTILIGAVDGLNPCALWVLLFLISLLIGMQEKRKLLILGGTFILVSAVFYYLVLAAWLNFLLFVGFIFWIRIIIGLIAIFTGSYYIKEWLDKKRGCSVVNEDRRKKIISQVKEILAREKIWLALGGIVFLAVSVNMFKALCSAGLPAVYAQVLALSGLPKWQYYAYLALYILAFESYEIIILGIALLTFKMQAVSPKFINRVTLLGGVIMLIIGFLLILKPGWLMLG